MRLSKMNSSGDWKGFDLQFVSTLSDFPFGSSRPSHLSLSETFQVPFFVTYPYRVPKSSALYIQDKARYGTRTTREMFLTVYTLLSNE